MIDCQDKFVANFGSVTCVKSIDLSNSVLKGVVVIIPRHRHCTSVVTSCNGVEACRVKQGAFDNLCPPTVLGSLQRLVVVARQVEFEERVELFCNSRSLRDSIER